MANVPFNIRQPYLITQREFPKDTAQLTPVLYKSYIDIAAAVNARVIGLYDRIQVVTGERWFNDNTPQGGQYAIERRQSYRQIYTFGAIAPGATLTINHNISNPVNFTHIYGTCIVNDPGGFNYRPIPYASATLLISTQIEVKVSATQINISNGNTAPNIISGILILEYLLV